MNFELIVFIASGQDQAEIFTKAILFRCNYPYQEMLKLRFE